MVALPQKPISETDYLSFERTQETKHEFINGEIIAMTGASEEHNLICVSTLVALYIALRNRHCKVYGGDMRIKVEATRLYTYPDISIICGEATFSDDRLDTLTNPQLIIEVLSPSTERYDRGKKFQNYRQIPSLQEYLLIAQESAVIEHYQRLDEATWRLTTAEGLSTSLLLPTLDITLALADVYEKITFPPS